MLLFDCGTIFWESSILRSFWPSRQKCVTRYMNSLTGYFGTIEINWKCYLTVELYFERAVIWWARAIWLTSYACCDTGKTTSFLSYVAAVVFLFFDFPLMLILFRIVKNIGFWGVLLYYCDCFLFHLMQIYYTVLMKTLDF